MTAHPRLRARTAWPPFALALMFLAGHLPFLASGLEDLDSVNFALGVRRFDVAEHQPHPPGYPVFIAIARVATAAVRPFPGTEDAYVARGLALCGALCGALAAWPLLTLFTTIEGHVGRARGAAVLVLASPLVWFNASRPLSDVTGLAFATAAQALLALGFAARAAERGGAIGEDAGVGRRAWGGDRAVVLGAFCAGVAIGVRSQALWLTIPLWLVVLADRGRAGLRLLTWSGLALAAGALLWLVPLVALSGGIAPYLAALGGQAGDDFSDVSMLATRPTPRAVLFALLHTFVDPWATPWLAAIVLALVAAGAAVIAVRSPRGALLLSAAFGPYLLFHLLFQEPVTNRYAIPVVVPVAYLAVRGLAVVGPRTMTAGVATLVVASLAVTAPALAAYARGGSPLERVVADVRARGAGAEPRPVLLQHHAIALATRRTPLPVERLPPARTHLWRRAAQHWREGGTAPLWFLAEPEASGLDAHHDLAMIDPAAQRLERAYRWGFDDERLLGGARPSEIDWWVIDRPGWLAIEGWALTPRLAGTFARAGQHPGTTGATGLVARRTSPAVLMVGGRHLGTGDQPPLRFRARLDDRVVATWDVAPAAAFLRIWALPPGTLAGDGRYAALRIDAASAGGADTPRSAIEQFDVQPTTRPVFGFGSGWHEPEYNPATRRLWRWASGAADLVVHDTGRDLVVSIAGESPLRYFDAPPRVSLRAGAVELASLEPDDDFQWRVGVPAGVLRAARGVLQLTTSRTFSPAERGASADARRLGLRVYRVTVGAAPDVR